MTRERDTLAMVVAYHDHIAVPPFSIDDDLRRGRRRVRRNRGLVTAGIALVAGIAVTGPLLDGSPQADRLQPVAPGPLIEVTPSPTTTTDWTGPLRPGVTLPIVPIEATFERDDYFWTDGPDAGYSGIDILEVTTLPGAMHPEWQLSLREAPPLASTLDAAQRVIEYGVVVDADGDRVADCQIGISTDAPKAGDFRVWVRNLRTGVTDERVGPPYGFPIDFIHPDEQRFEDPTGAPGMTFGFLKDTVPCDPFSPSANFYAWASVTDEGRVTAWDYAPDAAWLAHP